MPKDLRELFSKPQGIYLLSHSVGLPPVNICDAWQRDFLSHWQTGGEATWPAWLELIEKFRLALATLLGTWPACICPQVNLSSALTKILQSRRVERGRNTIVYSEQDFPSMGFVLDQMRGAGYDLRCIPAEQNLQLLATWEQYLTADVAFVLVTHVHSNTSTQVPVEGIAALAREKGVRSIVDIAQSVGCVPIDLRRWQADFVIGSCVKWLCGGPGAGFLWASPEAISDSAPIDVGWFSHQDPFEFDIHHFAYADDALRFWGGTPSVQPYAVAAHSIGLLNEIGVSTIHQHNLDLRAVLTEKVDGDDIVSPRQEDSCGGTVVFNFSKAKRAHVIERLRALDVKFDVRSTGLRLSPHIYNTVEEMRAVADLFSAS